MLITTRDQHVGVLNILKSRIADLDAANDTLNTDAKFYSGIIIELIESDYVDIDIDIFELPLSDDYIVRKLKKLLASLNSSRTCGITPTIKKNIKAFYDIVIKYKNNIVKKDDNLRLLAKLKNSKLYNTLLTSFNLKAVSSMLDGGEVSFGVCSMLIVEKDRYSRSMLVNHDVSNKLRKKLIEEGKPLYSRENPDGYKWVVHHDSDVDYWWVIKNRQKRVKNSQFYTFTPIHRVATNEIKGRLNNPSNLKADFLARCETKEDIIDSTYLGSMDKLRYLLDYDEFIHLKYRANAKRSQQQRDNRAAFIRLQRNT